MKTTAVLTILTITFLCVSNVLAVTFDWALIGNPGNAADPETGFGAVSHSYRISKHEVTNAQYAEFLNAVAKTDADATDTNALYSILMKNSPAGGITQSGTNGSYVYTVKPGQANQPVVWVSFIDAMRFVNWLENGQPTGLQGVGTTEDGVYAIDNGLNEIRSASATFFIPSEDEWYKAAYHDSTAGQSASYFDYPMGTDTIPYSDNPSALNTPDDTNTGNFRKEDLVNIGYDDGFAVTGLSPFDFSQNYLTDVGAYSISQSPYGTFDQGGNVFEWNETTVLDERVLRGGSWGNFVGALAASFRGDVDPTLGGDNRGFRVATVVPEPSTLLLGAMAAVGLLLRRGRREGR